MNPVSVLYLYHIAFVSKFLMSFHSTIIRVIEPNLFSDCARSRSFFIEFSIMLLPQQFCIICMVEVVPFLMIFISIMAIDIDHVIK